MTIQANDPLAYIEAIEPVERRVAFEQLRQVILENLPDGFEEAMSYGMIGYVVPFQLYPAGYHCNPKLPLPFINIAAQKNFLALYHMGIYLSPPLMEWFVAEFPKHSNSKLDMGKSCIRFKKTTDIPYALIGALMRKTSLADWITCYESKLKK